MGNIDIDGNYNFEYFSVRNSYYEKILGSNFFLSIIMIYSCSAQRVKELTEQNNTIYILANIYKVNYSFYSLYNSFFVNVYSVHDSRVTLDKDFEGTDEVLSSILVSVFPDGDFYETSKLFKIERVLDPKVIEIKETTFPKFIISIEDGLASDRKIKEYVIEANFGK